MRVLKKIDNSVLWLLKSNSWAEINLKDEAKKRKMISIEINPTVLDYQLLFIPFSGLTSSWGRPLDRNLTVGRGTSPWIITIAKRNTSTSNKNSKNN